MPRLKRRSNVIVHAQQRAAGLATIDPKLDLGNDLTLTFYNEEIARVQAILDAYNSALSAADAAQNALQDAEQQLAEYSARMLAGAAAKYGKDSQEYELAGGTRPSERKRPARKEPVVL